MLKICNFVDLQARFQETLRTAENDPKLHITHVEETEGCKLGENFMSVVLEERVTGQRGSGELYSGSFITKYYPYHRAIAKALRNADFFFNEAYVYNHVLPQLGDIAPRCIYATQEEILLVNLKTEGYVMMPRLKLLDLEHCIAVVRALATLHARSYALKQKDPERFKELMSLTREVIFPVDNAPCMGSSMDVSVTTAITFLKSLDDSSEELRSAIDFMENLVGKSVDIMRELVLSDRGKYDVLSHGDVWNNNILFKHDTNGRVIDVKLIDFQIPRHTSAAIDFHYFMYSSAKSSVIEGNYEKVVKSYHSALVDNLRQLNVPQEDVEAMSLDWFQRELQKRHMYGFIMSCWMVNAVLAGKNEIYNMDNFSDDFTKEIENSPCTITRRKSERVRCIVIHCLKRYRPEILKKNRNGMNRGRKCQL